MRSRIEKPLLLQIFRLETTTMVLNKQQASFPSRSVIPKNQLRSSYSGRSYPDMAKAGDKFARRSIMERDASQMLLLNFQLMETKSANKTIERYEGIIDKCEEQGVKM